MADNFIRITPFIHVKDLDNALAFFEGTLGFTKYIHFGTYAYLEREKCGIRLMQDADAPAGTRRFAHYIDVEDIEKLYAELKPKLAGMPAGDVHGPADKPYGQRELCILAPDGNLIVFGQTIE